MKNNLPGCYRPVPNAQAIALALLADRDVLRLRTAALQRDIMERFKVGRALALHGIELATSNGQAQR